MYSVFELHNTWHHGLWPIEQNGQQSKLVAIQHGESRHESRHSAAVYACNLQIVAHEIPAFSLLHDCAHLHRRCHGQNAGRTADD